MNINDRITELKLLNPSVDTIRTIELMQRVLIEILEDLRDASKQR